MTKSIKNNVSHFEEYSRIEKAIAEMENVTSNTKYTFNLCCEKVHNNFEGASNTISFPKANFSSLCLNNTMPIETNDSDEVDAEKEAQIVMDYLFPENEQQHCVFFDNEGMGVAVLKIRDAKDCETIRFMVVTYCYYSGSFSSVRFLKSEKTALIRYVVNILNISSDKISVRAYVILSIAMVNQALSQQRASSKPLVTDNERYSFRTWLLSMGFIGDEFKTPRKLLLFNLSGDSAWRYEQVGKPYLYLTDDISSDELHNEAL